METPFIPTTDGGKVAVTILDDSDLLVAYLGVVSDAEDEDLATLLLQAEPDASKAGAVLRQCLEGGKRLIPVYPRLKETPPDGATLVGAILDGALYLL